MLAAPGLVGEGPCEEEQAGVADAAEVAAAGTRGYPASTKEDVNAAAEAVHDGGQVADEEGRGADKPSLPKRRNGEQIAGQGRAIRKDYSVPHLNNLNSNPSNPQFRNHDGRPTAGFSKLTTTKREPPRVIAYDELCERDPYCLALVLHCESEC
jgi:hypothetical protein